MRSNQISVVITLLFFGGLAWAFAAIVLHFYRADIDTAAAAAHENQATVARAAAREEMARFVATLPEALPVPSTSTLHHRPAMGNALIQDEAQWRQLQSDLIAVDLADVRAAGRGEAAVPTPISDAPAVDGESANTREAAATPAPTTPTTMRNALHEGGYVIVECCRLQDAAAGAEAACACVAPPRDAAVADAALPAGVPSCADVAVNHVKSPDTCFFLFKASAAPYGQSRYITATDAAVELV